MRCPSDLIGLVIVPIYRTGEDEENDREVDQVSLNDSHLR